MKPRGRKRKLAASGILILRLLFGGPQLASANYKTFQSGVNFKTEISRNFVQESSMIADSNHEGSTQPELVLEGSQRTLDTPSGQIIFGLRCGAELNPKSGPGPRAKADAANRARNLKAGNSQSGVSPFADGFRVEPKFHSRPGQNRDRLFSRFARQPTTDPRNPGGAGGPRSITVLSSQGNMKKMSSASSDENGFVMSYDEAFKLISDTYPGSTKINEDFKVSDWQIAKKAYHFQQGFNIDLDKYDNFGKQDLTNIQKGGTLPPTEFVNDVRNRLVDFCHHPKTQIIKNATHYNNENSTGTASTIFLNEETKQIAVFNRTSADLIMADKFKEAYFKKVIQYNQTGRFRK